jgi:nucleoside diphosphate kinase
MQTAINSVKLEKVIIVTYIRLMSNYKSEFVFIMLKPVAAKNQVLSDLITSKLEEFGDIRYMRKGILVDKEKIRQHYKYSQRSFWYPFITNYLSGKLVSFFILEQNDEKYLIPDADQRSFAQFLRNEIIGPSDICKIKKHHLRRLALQKPTFMLDNLIHCSDNTLEALEEIDIWYEDDRNAISLWHGKSDMPPAP